MRIVFLFLLTIFCLSNSTEASAQCREFVKFECIPHLQPYLHDGNYQSLIMAEGEEAEIYKTVFGGMQYRLMICTAEGLPQPQFVVTDIHRKVLFDSSTNGASSWDFATKNGQQLKISIKLPRPSASTTPREGCVGILFGIKE